MLRQERNPSVLRRSHQRSFAIAGETLDPAWLAASGVQLPKSLDTAVQKRRMEYAAGRYAATLACRDAGIAQPIEIATRSDRSPDWPVGVVGAITHTDGFISAAVADASVVRGIGIDAEGVMAAETIDTVRDLIASPTEQALGMRVRGALSEAAFYTLLFSAKESIYKCLNPIVHCFFDFKDVEIYRIDFDRNQFFFRLVTTLSSEFTAGFRYYGNFEVTARHVHTAVELLRTQSDVA